LSVPLPPPIPTLPFPPLPSTSNHANPSGATRPETSLSEAASYHNLALANRYFDLLPMDDNDDDDDDEDTTASRILLDEQALDSYHNILFSLVAFWRRHAVWPARLTIVSHAFKRARLVDGHCAAIGFPLDRVAFVGINAPGMDAVGLDEAGGGAGEKEAAWSGVQLALGQWEADPHGVGEELLGKRVKRNCWGVSQRLFLSKEEGERSGVDIRELQDGSEGLLPGGRRPWAEIS
jgi:hypothetical protein